MFPASTAPASAHNGGHPNPYTTETCNPQGKANTEQPSEVAVRSLSGDGAIRLSDNALWPESPEGWLAHFG